jgi:hypothetical protein
MIGNDIRSSALGSEHYATSLDFGGAATQGYWAYTSEGDVFVSNACTVVVDTDDSPGLTSTLVETCF